MSNPEIDYFLDHSVDPKSIDDFGDYVVNNWFSADSDREPLRSLFIMCTGLSGETGEVLEKIKKHVRDGTLDKDALKKELGDVFFYLCRICREYGFQPSEVLTACREKLDSRRARGTMRGSGDNR